MIILGLTGSIGMGKSAVSNVFLRYKVPVFDADLAVHDLLRSDVALYRSISEYFPDACEGGVICRERLGEIVFSNEGLLRLLEGLIHPHVKRLCWEFIKSCQRRRCALVVLDIPLLFEVHMDRWCDYTLVVSTPFLAQRARVLRREGMSRKKFRNIRRYQLSDFEKRCRSDFTIITGLSFRFLSERVHAIILKLLQHKQRRRNFISLFHN